MLTRQHRQEALSRAYVRAVAALAGVICSEPEQDYGVDLCLRAVRQRGKRHMDSSGQVDLQLKSTTRAGIGETHVIYDLDVQAYDDLREEGDNCPRILVVLVLPDDENLWLTQSQEELILRHCAYWMSLLGEESVDSTSTVRIRIPRANVFSADTIRQLLSDLRTRRGS